VAAVLEKTARSGAASFLSVMKTFGDCPSPGLLSFPRKGLTLAMDFPNLGDRALRLMRELDEVVLGRGGILYPAKDARMSAACFQESYPQWKEFAGFIDPRFSSSFWRRVTP
jgi:FAD/FMN-containing dehydrogenase